MSKPRRKFTREFKEEAVRLVTDQGYTVKQAAENLEIGENILWRWGKTILEAAGNRFFPSVFSTSVGPDKGGIPGCGNC